MIARGLAGLAAATLLLLWLRPTPADRLLGTWVVDEAAWAERDPYLRGADGPTREAVLAPTRRTPMSFRFDSGGHLSLTVRDVTREGSWSVLRSEGDALLLDVSVDGPATGATLRLAGDRCLLDLGAGPPLPLRRLSPGTRDAR